MEFEVKSPILGFEEIRRMRLEKIDDLFMTLKNAQGDTPTFTLANPYALREYDFDIPLAMQLLLEIKEGTSLLVLNIMIIGNPIEHSTINFLAPLLFNFDNQSMAQVILDSTRYPNYGITEFISGYLKQEDSERESHS